ncbi:hypothetical protein [Flectobacillus roseus]|uniref:hypothetical protein n=1 Tax=Flectobacillus roseus TaxID=502259 RepID=UPI0024B77289|nr:hypothetical protein [Flectobacillus roseus]MDI9872176.1 hypothetical protein [Flectobacillus roseus]
MNDKEELRQEILQVKMLLEKQAQQSQNPQQVADKNGLQKFFQVALQNPKTTVAGLGVLVLQLVKVFMPEMAEKVEMTSKLLEGYIGVQALDASAKPKPEAHQEEMLG